VASSYQDRWWFVIVNCISMAKLLKKIQKYKKQPNQYEKRGIYVYTARQSVSRYVCVTCNIAPSPAFAFCLACNVIAAAIAVGVFQFRILDSELLIIIRGYSTRGLQGCILHTIPYIACTVLYCIVLYSTYSTRQYISFQYVITLQYSKA